MVDIMTEQTRIYQTENIYVDTNNYKWWINKSETLIDAIKHTQHSLETLRLEEMSLNILNFKSLNV